MAANSFSQSSSKTYILVHGAGHGAWCWEKIVPLLESKGYNIITLDLPSVGNDTVQLANISLDDDVNQVINAANTIDGKVSLVGHSSGGVIISQAAELLGAEKIDKLIYLDAFLPQNGESVLSIAGKINENSKDISNASGPKPELLIFSEDKKCCKWNPDLAQQIFYHDCSPEDIAFAKAHLAWQCVSTLATPVQLSESNYGAIKKYYILCTEAKDMNKSSLTSYVHCEKIYELASSHSPFFSMPEKLVDILVAIN